MKSVLITGASSGFGRGLALGLARQGWLVFASMRDLGKADGLITASEALDGTGRVIPVALDVTKPASIAAAVEHVLKETGGTLDVLVNNAGYSILGAFEDCSEETCRQQMETNFFGALGVTRTVLPAMRKAQQGRIVVVTSNAVNSPHPLLTMYAASKWALEGWAEGLAMEVAPFGIEVAVVQPGAHRTEFAGNVDFIQAEASAYGRWLETALPGITNLDRWGRDPERGIADIVETVTAAHVPFRQQVGEDAKIFAALKGAAPYEARALALRAIVGLPGPGAFVDGPAPAEQNATLAEVLQLVLAAAKSDPLLAQTVAQTFALDS